MGEVSNYSLIFASILVNSETRAPIIIFAGILLLPAIVRYAKGAIQGYIIYSGPSRIQTGFSVFLALALIFNVVAIYLFLRSAWIDQYIFSQISSNIGADSIYSRIHFQVFTLFASVLLFRVFYTAAEYDRGVLYESAEVHILTSRNRSHFEYVFEVMLRLFFTAAAMIVFGQVISKGVVNISVQHDIVEECATHTGFIHYSTYSMSQCMLEVSSWQVDEINAQFAKNSNIMISLSLMSVLYFLMLFWNIFVDHLFERRFRGGIGGIAREEDFRARFKGKVRLQYFLVGCALVSLGAMFIWVDLVCPYEMGGRACSQTQNASVISGVGIGAAVVGLIIFSVRAGAEYLSLLRPAMALLRNALLRAHAKIILRKPNVEATHEKPD